MAYKIRWNAVFAKPLLNQLVAIIQRDQVTAIAALVAAGLVGPNLIPFAAFMKGRGSMLNLPVLRVGTSDTGFDRDAVGSRHTENKIVLAMYIGQFDDEFAQDTAADYLKLVDTIIESCDLAPQNPGPGSSWETPLAIAGMETVPANVTTPPPAG